MDEPEGVTAKIESAVSLAGIGATFKASELRRKLGFSDPEDSDEVMDGAPAMRTCSSACWAAAPSSWPGWSPS